MGVGVVVTEYLQGNHINRYRLASETKQECNLAEPSLHDLFIL